MQGMPVSLPESFSLNPQGADIGLWPLAWGWWILTILCLILALSTVLWLRARYKRGKALREALKTLKTVAQESEQLPLCNQIIKRAFMSYFPPSMVASLHGLSWTQFLEQQLKPNKKAQFESLFLALNTGLYQNANATNNAELDIVATTSALLKQTLPPSKKRVAQLETHHD